MDNEKDKTERLALVGFICGLVSIFILPLAFGSAAIVFGIITTGRAEKDSRAYTYARTGIVLGIVGLVLWVVALFTMSYLSIDLNGMLGISSPEPSAF
jgi:uncharacterized membrane protein HdeD (DUF308 family)